MSYIQTYLKQHSWLMLLIAFLALSSCQSSRRAARNENDAKNTSIANKKFYAEHSLKLGYELSGKENKDFIKEVSAWIGTPYKYGGKTKAGTDCSGFVQTFYKEFYKKDLYRSASDMVKNVRFIDKKDLKEGDLIFFKIEQNKVSHVGMYISKNKFVHASTKRGVIVNDLSEAYYKKYYYACGRVK